MLVENLRRQPSTKMQFYCRHFWAYQWLWVLLVVHLLLGNPVHTSIPSYPFSMFARWVSSKYTDINGNRTNNKCVYVYSQISVIILAVCILFLSFVFEFHANCILCWIYGINFGAFRYTFKMLVLERIKTKQFARVWGKLKSSTIKERFALLSFVGTLTGVLVVFYTEGSVCDRTVR